jgi:hypothetical protein
MLFLPYFVAIAIWIANDTVSCPMLPEILVVLAKLFI